MPCGAAAEEESPFAEISYSLSQLTNSIIIPLVRAWYNKLPLDAPRYFLGMVLCGASGHEKGLVECFINVPQANTAATAMLPKLEGEITRVGEVTFEK